MTVSGLSPRHAAHARSIARRAAFLGLNHAPELHYTMGTRRWEGIARNKIASKKQYPHYADCSAFVTWCLWNGLRHFKVRDVVNGARWKAGYTGTMLERGVAVHGALQVGDAVIYGSGFPGEHTAIYVGGGKVISHGSEPGPFLLPVRYRSDVLSVRRYI